MLFILATFQKNLKKHKLTKTLPVNTLKSTG